MDLFGALVFQVIGQQISVIAATAIFARLTDRFGGRAPDPSELAAVDPGTLRGLGLSRRKAATVLDLAQRFSDGRLSEAELRQLPDQEVIRRLTEVKGIGAWTVQGALLDRAAAARRHPHGRPSPPPRDQGELRPRPPPRRLPRWQTSPNTGGRTGASPPACCWPPRDRAESVNGGSQRRSPCPATGLMSRARSGPARPSTGTVAQIRCCVVVSSHRTARPVTSSSRDQCFDWTNRPPTVQVRNQPLGTSSRAQFSCRRSGIARSTTIWWSNRR